MSRRASAYVVTLLLGTGGALLLPQLGWASSGGATLTPSGGTSPASPSKSARLNISTGVVQRANVSVQASGNGITIETRASAILQNGLHFTGQAPASASGQVVEVERRGRQTGWTWAPTAHGTVQSNGSFSAQWPANHIGQFDIRAVLERRQGSAARASASSPSVSTIVYRPSIATYYGTGFYGSRTACGEKLTATTLGTANRTLKCGTLVAVYYGGRMIVVPVIDRGPYANHADWDLTEATARKLGTPGIAHVGAVSLPAK